jgi:hypothetical protein
VEFVMHKRVRELLALARKAGLSAVSVEPGGKHSKLVGRTPAGGRVAITVATTPRVNGSYKKTRKQLDAAIAAAWGHRAS